MANAEPKTNDALDLSEDELSALKALFSRLMDEEGKTTLSARELSGVAIGVVNIDDKSFKRIDKDRSGYLTPEEILNYCYPKVPKARIQNYFTRTITSDVFIQFKAYFAEIAPKGKLTEAILLEVGEELQGLRFTVDMLRKSGQSALSLIDVLSFLYPSLEEGLVDGFNATKISIDEYQKVKMGFQELDREDKGFLVAKDFNRTSPKGSDEGKPQLLRTGQRTSSGMRYDIQLFNRIDKDKTGQVTFVQLLKAFYPSLSDRMIKGYIEGYTPERVFEFKQQRQIIESDEEKRRSKFVSHQDKMWTKLLQMFASGPGSLVDLDISRMLGASSEFNSGDNDDFNDHSEFVVVSEAMMREREKEAKDRLAIESIEDGDRWYVVVEEHRERIRFAELQMMQFRAVGMRMYCHKCLKDEKALKEGESSAAKKSGKKRE